MHRRLTNLLLLGLVCGLVGTGVAPWVFALAVGWPLYDLHRVLGFTLALALFWKYGVARSSLGRRLGRRRPDRSVLVGLAAALPLHLSLGLGLGWGAGLVTFDTFDGYSALNLHIFLAYATLPLMLWHMARRWERKPALGRLVSRRTVLTSAATAALAVLGWRGLDAVAAQPRRVTGSKHAGSFSGNAYPATIWLFDEVPAIAPPDWRVHVRGDVDRPAAFDLAALAQFPRREVRTVLDCTGGWWSEQDWSGWAVGDLLDAAGVRPDVDTVRVVSTTGHGYPFPLDELRGALIATHVGGEPLSPEHGAPARLVVPDRRGFQWVKWIDRIEVG